MPSLDVRSPWYKPLHKFPCYFVKGLASLWPGGMHVKGESKRRSQSIRQCPAFTGREGLSATARPVSPFTGKTTRPWSYQFFSKKNVVMATAPTMAKGSCLSKIYDSGPVDNCTTCYA